MTSSVDVDYTNDLRVQKSNLLREKTGHDLSVLFRMTAIEGYAELIDFALEHLQGWTA